MKRTISTIMALALAATLSTVVFAAENDDGNIKKNISVKAKYVEDIKTSKLSVPTLCGAKWSSHTA